MPLQQSSSAAGFHLRPLHDESVPAATPESVQVVHQLNPRTTEIAVGTPTLCGTILFSSGPIGMASTVMQFFKRIHRDPRHFLVLHLTGTWGTVDSHRVGLNQASIDDCFGTVRSLYDLGNLLGIAATIEIATTLAPREASTTVMVHGLETGDAPSQSVSYPHLRQRVMVRPWCDGEIRTAGIREP